MRCVHIFLRFLPDKLYIALHYYKHFHSFPSLKNPRTFNEKLQWLKLYDHRPEYTMMVDKYAVKQYISDKIGSQYVIPLLGVWEKGEDIDFDSLPEQFVLKTNHDSKGVVICKDKSKLDINQTIDFLNGHLRNNGFWYGREWSYKDVIPRIIAEQYMTDQGEDLVDYKILNFNGIPKAIQVCRNRFKESGLTQDYYLDTWERINVKRADCPVSSCNIEAPAELEEMLRLSRILSKDIPFLRTDFYIINHRVYLGELTFYPTSGLAKFEPKQYDEIFGKWLTLPI